MKHTTSLKSVMAFMLAILFTGMVSAADNGGLDSLRSDSLELEAPAQAMKKTFENDGVMARDFIQQPPLIPHDIRGYDIDKDHNSCLRCHSWKNASKWGATRISVTHFYDRDGKQLADVAPGRYFCVQCHVPQADAKPLKDNGFEPVDSLK
ncbi:nitrate reductase cytochrome c-type subunit [Endozoicomonadaceae bacterium StTr2]